MEHLAGPRPARRQHAMTPTQPAKGEAAPALIDRRIAALGDWRGDTLRRMRALIRTADPEVAEQWKWMGTPVWSHDGVVCTGESYKASSS
ncbi:amino acid permease [Burkholderia plantarii]|uniref:Amino acid permease n=1 Tax=Burkholderia plantarii TaxID=41899 RepID=A0A0B6SAG8_BURPL|nr:amino acid permease [Burkholderia plantarii]